MTIVTTSTTPTVVIDGNTVHVSPFGPANAAWAVIRESPSVSDIRARDVELLEELECYSDALIRNDTLKSYQRELILRPPAPDGGPTLRYTIVGTRVRVTTDLAGRALEARAWPNDRFDESTYWTLSGASLAEAMDEEVEAALRFNAAERNATIDRIESRDPNDHRPLLQWFDKWFENSEDAAIALAAIRSEGGRARAYQVTKILTLAG
ncbi:hypothetical protein ACFQ9V_13280 [Leifsonia sp. NPDC056665]|uniref:hypothetical protein n=1 Tax=Leifsonia sp. NPDC056665 TaxID=3345901 RepID=UPI0036BF9B8B